MSSPLHKRKALYWKRRFCQWALQRFWVEHLTFQLRDYTTELLPPCKLLFAPSIEISGYAPVRAWSITLHAQIVDVYMTPESFTQCHG